MELAVWMNGRHVGVWGQSRNNRDWFRYDPEWLRSPLARNLSLSLPITAGDARLSGPEVGHFFDNLLPGRPRLRERLRQRYCLRSAGAFDLLSAIGRDCVGAVQLLPPGTEPTGWNSIQSEPLTTQQVEHHLEQVPLNAPFAAAERGRKDAFRISIAGVQEKTALLRMGTSWHLPTGATPTTHILKLPVGAAGLPFEVADSIENEWACAAILKELGLPVARTEIGRFGARKALVVERFDRRWQGIEREPYKRGFKPPEGAWIARLPQEDFCQATGTPSEAKHESNGGPGITRVLEILASSEKPLEDRRTFALAQLAFWLLAAIDGHAKNFSIYHGRDGFSLTPLYDVLSAWPFIGRGARRLQIQEVKLAMALRDRSPHYLLREIQPRHFADLAGRMGDPGAWPSMRALVDRVPEALARVERALSDDFPAPLWESIARGTAHQRDRFLAANGPRVVSIACQAFPAKRE